MFAAVAASVRHLVARLHARGTRPDGRVPSRDVLVAYAGRQSVAVGLVASAAALVYVSGSQGQVLPYVLMAGALACQVLNAAVALGDDDRRRRLRASGGPSWFLGSGAVVLAVTGLVGWLGGEPAFTSVTATVAAAGLAMAAAPTSLVFVPNR